MDLNKISTPWKFLFVLSLLVGVLVGIIYLFQVCWNLGLVPALGLAGIEFEAASYLVGLISLVGLLFRGFGHGNNSSSGK
jgi:hypothetical protein